MFASLSSQTRIAALCAPFAALVATLCLAAPPAKKPPPIRFSRDIRPMLSDKCFKCHGPDPNARKADLRLDTQEDVFRLRNGKSVVVPGKPLLSPLYLRLIEKIPALRMPPPNSHRTLTAEQIESVKRWIEQGAKWEKHWSFIPPVRPALPVVRNAAWVKNPIDAFLLAKMEKEGIAPSPEASKETLLRRVTLDLTGLPPTLAEIDTFLADKSPNAYEKTVDRLLASPRFGERMVWDWLDAARYSDTNGFQEDRARPMWPWRDWAIDALNQNMPFDQFTLDQIAGDLLPNPTTRQRLATGFHRNNMLNGEGGRIPEESRVEYVVDRVETTATTWLGLTMGCARCHSHKYDPFTQTEFYQLYSYFNSIDETGAVDRDGAANPVMPLPNPEQEKQLDTLQKRLTELAALPDSEAVRKERDKLTKERNDLNSSLLQVMIMKERKEPRETHLLLRGVYDKPGEKVTQGIPAILNPLPKDKPNNRLGLAYWLIDAQNPLTARVVVNRFWQNLFGIGLVKTSEDFGAQGEAPSHPDLLDWLATEFMRSKWNVKGLLKQIVLSAAYRQSSKATPALLAKDPENRLLARAPRYRLPAFMLRDQVLAMSGLLVEKRGGAPVKPYQPEGVWEDFSYGKITYQQDHGESLYRRSLYTFWRRSVAPPLFFDSAARRVCTVRQSRTNTPLQALTLLNDVTFVEAARVFATNLLQSDAKTPEARLAKAFRMATGRRPTPPETLILVRSLKRSLVRYQGDAEAAQKLIHYGEYPVHKDIPPAELAAYTSVLNLLLNLDEVLNKE